MGIPETLRIVSLLSFESLNFNENEIRADHQKENHGLGSLTLIAFSSGIYFAWICLGVIFYKYYDHFDTSTAFYYSLDAGLSIGYCNPTERNNLSKLFTIFYVILGSIIVTGSITAILASVFLQKARPLTPDASYYNEGYSIQDSPLRGTLEFSLRSLTSVLRWKEIGIEVSIILLFCIWIILGTLIGIFVQKLNVIASIYW